jgi:16S rRNA (guanine966-N2)-methyltransferase
VSIRIIAGRFKRRQLATPTGLATRPTAARAREALFSVLGDMHDLTVLDLYAGSGALGIEALSRGARHALLVERDRSALACIRKNIAELGIEDECSVLPLAVERLAPARLLAFAPFELVFCDPPWAELDATVRVLPSLVGALAPGARVVLEHPAKREPALVGFSRDDMRRWGDTGVSIFVRTDTPSSDGGPDTD